MDLPNSHRRVLDIYRDEGHVKAWNYWKLLGFEYGIFLGEIPSEDFINGGELCSRIALDNEGKKQNNDTPWLKFILDGTIIYVPLKSIRRGVSWKQIYDTGSVYGTDDYGSYFDGDPRPQDTKVEINGNIFRVTLLKGISEDAFPRRNIENELTRGSEWNRLLYPIHDGHNIDMPNGISDTTILNVWAGYTDSDFSFTETDGSRILVQEHSENTRMFCRGKGCITKLGSTSSSFHLPRNGYLPALRLIS